MANVFLNGLNSKTGGGKSILKNYLALLQKNGSNHQYFILTPDRDEYNSYRTDHIEIIDIKATFKKNVYSPFVYSFLLPKLLKDLHIDLLFNMGDIVIPSRTKQIYLFDWPYAMYPESPVWKMMDAQSYLNRRIKLFFFKSYLAYATQIIAQTETAKKRLARLYGLQRISIVPNAVSLENVIGGEFLEFQLPKDKKKLLYLTYYYSHKNLEIFIPLAKKIKALARPYCLITTIDASQHAKAAQFLKTIRVEQLEDIIINVGPVHMKNVPSLYRQCDALLMPTLLESFSGTYVEAMYHGKTIFTSNLDFANDVCGDSAFYFDPFCADSILQSLESAYQNDVLRNWKIEAGKNKLKEMPSWEQAFNQYQVIIEQALSTAL